MATFESAGVRRIVTARDGHQGVVMPREIVAVSPQSFGIEIVWKRGMYAQIGVRTREGETLDAIESLWADLDLEQIDNLMKVLRRVRKQLVMVPSESADETYKPILV